MNKIDRAAIYKGCLDDLALVGETFTDGKCKNQTLARSRLIGLKAKWAGLIRRYKGTEVEAVISEAATRLPNASRRPDSWQGCLFDTEEDFRFRLDH